MEAALVADAVAVEAVEGADVLGAAAATYAGTQVDEAGFETPRPPGTLVGGARPYFGFETN